MDYIKSWTFCICVTLIISVIFSVLAPKGAMGKFYKVIISVFIFLSFIYPLSQFDYSDYKMDFDFESEYENVVESSAKFNLESTIINLLEENGIYNSSITADVKQNGEEIIINRLLISVTDIYDTEDVKQLLFDKLGLVAEVKQIGE